MRKPDSLRAQLTLALPWLARKPDALAMFIDRGRIVARVADDGAGNAEAYGYEWRYDLKIWLQDFPASDPDTAARAVIAWMARNEPAILLNHDTAGDAVAMEAEIIDERTVDLLFTLQLSEAVIFDDNGGVTYLDEPQIAPGFEGVAAPAPLSSLIANGEQLLGDE